MNDQIVNPLQDDAKRGAHFMGHHSLRYLLLFVLFVPQLGIFVQKDGFHEDKVRFGAVEINRAPLDSIEDVILGDLVRWNLILTLLYLFFCVSWWVVLVAFPIKINVLIVLVERFFVVSLSIFELDCAVIVTVIVLILLRGFLDFVKVYHSILVEFQICCVFILSRQRVQDLIIVKIIAIWLHLIKLLRFYFYAWHTQIIRILLNFVSWLLLWPI